MLNNFHISVCVCLVCTQCCSNGVLCSLCWPWTYYVPEDNLEFLFPLLLPSVCWDYKNVSSYPAYALWGNWPQDLVYARQVFYQWSHILKPVCLLLSDVSIQIRCRFFNEVFCYCFVLRVLGSLCILILIPYHIHNLWIFFSHSIGCIDWFISFLHKIFLIWLELIYFCFCYLYFWVLF